MMHLILAYIYLSNLQYPLKLSIDCTDSACQVDLHKSATFRGVRGHMQKKEEKHHEIRVKCQKQVKNKRKSWNFDKRKFF